MRSRVAGTVTALWLTAACSAPASGQTCDSPQVALLIGNGAYPDNDKPLSEPVGNVRLLAAKLKELGFETEAAENLTRDTMRLALERLYNRVGPDATVALVFSGIGLQSEGKTYLVPVDAAIWSDHDIRTYGTSLDSVIAAINAKGARRKVLIIDGARRNPFERRFRTTGSAGLAPVSGDTGALVFYSVVPGKSFSDAGGDHSPFVDDLVKEIGKPAATAEDAFRRTRLNISRSAGTGLVPWVSSSLLEDFPFRKSECKLVSTAAAPGGEKVAAPATAPPPAAPTNPPNPQPAAVRTAPTATPVAPGPSNRRPPEPLGAPVANEPEARDAKAGAKVGDAKASAAKAESPPAPPSAPPPNQRDRVAATEVPRRGTAIDVAAFQASLADPNLVAEVRDRLYEQNYNTGSGSSADLGSAIVTFEKTAGLPQVDTPSEGLLESLRRKPVLKPWGTIVFAKEAGKWGMSWGHDTRREAVVAAQARCGSPLCTAALSFHGEGCAAFALSARGWSITSRNGSVQARQAALEECGRHGVACRVIGAVCADGPERAP